jgi:long-chain acyl-CoA synthetase
MTQNFAEAKRRPPAAICDGDIIDWRQAGTVWSLFCERVRRTPYAIAYREYNRSAGKRCEYSWRTIAARVDLFRCALANDGLMPGDRVAVLLPSGIDWVSFDLGAHAQDSLLSDSTYL